MAEHKRQQQLQHNFPYLLKAALCAVHIHHQADQQRREEDAQQAGGRGGAHRSRYVTTGQRGKGDCGLHGGRQDAEVEKTGIELRADVDRRPPGKQHAQHREQNKGAAHHPQMQPPVTATGNNGFPGEFGPVHKEEQGDSGRSESFKEGDEAAAGWKKRGQ